MPATPGSDDLAARFAHQRYLLRRKVFRLFGGAFHIYTDAGDLVLFSEMKGMRIREDIRLYADDSKSVELLRIATQSVFDFAGTYDIFDSTDNQHLGSLKRQGLKSMFRDEWLVLSPEGREIGKVSEESAMKAVVRRVIELAAAFMPQRYDIQLHGRAVGTIQQNFNPFVQKVTVDFTPDAQGTLDPRLGLAMAVLILAIEGRQN